MKLNLNLTEAAAAKTHSGRFAFKRSKPAVEEDTTDTPAAAARPGKFLLKRAKPASKEEKTDTAAAAAARPARFSRKRKKSEDGEDVAAPEVAKKVKAKMPSYPRKTRFTLLIGDEGAILLYMKGNAVLSRQFVPDASVSNLEELKETIDKDRMAPITMIIDSIDQSFVQQTLPPVSSLSVQKLIKRRLERDFKPADIKGAIVLGKEKEGRKDWNFLMISVEKSPQLILWLDFIMNFENRFRGIVLLSVEAGIFMKNLERAMGVPHSGTGAEWKILVSHNKVGGFRQIILRNGRLIFTRLALPVGEQTAEVVAGHIEQEMVTTIEYLKRFGFNARAGLDVYIIASGDVSSLVDPRRFDAASFHAYSPHNIAELLGIRGATQPTDQFGDVVLASSIGSIRKYILKLTTVESRLFDKFQLFKYAQRLIGTFLVLGLVVYGAYIGYGLLIIRSDIEDGQQKQRISQQAHAAIKQEIESSKMDLELVSDQTDIYRQIKSERRNPIPAFDQLSKAIKFPVVLRAVQWKIGGTFPADKAVPSLVNYNLAPVGGLDGASPGMPPASGAGAPPSGTPDNGMPVDGAAPATTEVITMSLQVDFPIGLKSPALFRKFADDFLKELHSVMDGYVIAYTGVPPEYLDIKSLQMNFDQKPSESTLGQQIIPIEITVHGPMPIDAEGAKAP